MWCALLVAIPASEVALQLIQPVALLQKKLCGVILPPKKFCSQDVSWVKLGLDSLDTEQNKDSHTFKGEMKDLQSLY